MDREVRDAVAAMVADLRRLERAWHDAPDHTLERTGAKAEYEMCLRNAAPVLLDAAERCGELERKLNHEAYVSDKRAKERDLAERGRDTLRTHLDAAIARAERAEAERDRMRPVVEAAVEERDPMFFACTPLQHAVDDYLDGEPKEGA